MGRRSWVGDQEFPPAQPVSRPLFLPFPPSPPRNFLKKIPMAVSTSQKKRMVRGCDPELVGAFDLVKEDKISRRTYFVILFSFQHG